MENSTLDDLLFQNTTILSKVITGFLSLGKCFSRLLDQNFFGSEVIETAVLPPSDMRIKDEDADLKYQSIPIYDEDNVQGKAAGLIGGQRGAEVNDDDDDEGDDDDGGVGSTEKSEYPMETERNQGPIL